MPNLPPFPVTVVGSWPRPPWLLQTLKKRREMAITEEEFNRIADEAVLLAVKYQEDAGVDILTDGEQRRDNFYSFVADKLGGVKLMTVAELMEYVKDKARFDQILRAMDVPAFSIRNPLAVDRLRKLRPLALDEFRFLKEHTSRFIKITLPGPYMLTRALWVQALSSKAYISREDLAEDVVRILREEIRALAAEKCDFIQLDEPILMEAVYGEVTVETFMCAALLSKSDPKEELEFARYLVNETVKGMGGVKLGVHVCRGNWSRREDALLRGSYEPLVPYLMDMKVDQLVLEFATPRAGDIHVFKDYVGRKEIGLGVVNPRTDEVESKEFILSKVNEALKYFDPDKIYLNPDCGFATFAESPVNRAGIAFSKLLSISKAAMELRREYGG